MKKTKIFDQLDNILGNYMEGKASEQDLILHAKKVNDYLIEHPHPHDIEVAQPPHTTTEMMTEIEKYEAVNQAETLKELADVVRKIGGHDKRIEGLTKTFYSEQMAANCEDYTLSKHNVLTRKYGIRQQAMMILFYEK